MNRDQDAAVGMELAARAIHLMADGRDDEAFAALNTATHGEVTWTAGYLLAALRESTAARFGSAGRVALALHAAAKNIDEDVMATRLALLVQAGLAKGEDGDGNG